MEYSGISAGELQSDRSRVGGCRCGRSCRWESGGGLLGGRGAGAELGSTDGPGAGAPGGQAGDVGQVPEQTI